ncbi:NUDIX domain-containing protein [Streptomyces sp. NPDC046860]|uniref:NUDIX hydrolase n=1 Tax=Streptomyces sp. NPDC046860 TaxID=3154495 RepID=UPI0034034DDE
MSGFAPGGARITCRALVVDRERRALHVRDGAGGPFVLPAARAGEGDRTLLAAALRAVTERTRLAPGDLCLTPRLLTSPVHVEATGPACLTFTFVLYLARELAEPLPGADWLPLEKLEPPAPAERLSAAGLDGSPAPVNSSALIHDGGGRYLLHLRDNAPGIPEPGAFALLGGGREPGDRTPEDTLRPDELHRLRLDPGTRALLLRHAARSAPPPAVGAVPRPAKAPDARGTEPNIVGAHLYAEDGDGRVLLGLRHPGSAFAGSTWHFLAGHCERESAVTCLVREAYEEAGLVIDPADVDLAHVVHVLNGPAARPRLQLVFRARRWQGTPRLREPDKCLEWRWWAPDGLPEKLVPYTRVAIDGIRAGRAYSELGWCPA